jgi:hypothetical protein
MVDQGVKDDEETLKALIDIKVHRLREHKKRTLKEAATGINRGMLIYTILTASCRYRIKAKRG